MPRIEEIWMSSFGVEGDLTHMLPVGGAYERFRGTVEQARTLSRRFMEAVFGVELHGVGWARESPTKRKGFPEVRTVFARLEDIPNVGVSVTGDLRQLGITVPGDVPGLQGG